MCNDEILAYFSSCIQYLCKQEVKELKVNGEEAAAGAEEEEEEWEYYYEDVEEIKKDDGKTIKLTGKQGQAKWARRELRSN